MKFVLGRSRVIGDYGGYRRLIAYLVFSSVWKGRRCRTVCVCREGGLYRPLKVC
jgi:hypothetical protein